MSNAAVAKLLLVALAICWGLSWSGMRIALDEVSPWSMRVIVYAIGAVTLLLLLKAQGRSLAIPGGRDRLHVLVASLIFVVCFGLASTFAQLLANTSRVIVINYSMPVWSSLMAYFVLHERIDSRAAIGLALCIAGLGVLVFPAAASSMQEPVGLLLALCCALAWGGGTVYMKWARIKGDLLAITFWEVVVGLVAFSVFSLIFDGPPTFSSLHARTWAGLLYVGVFGTGFAFFIWFNIIGRLSTATASLGSLMNPIVGVIGAMILLGDRPTVTDMIGFALIFGAAACVLIPRRVRPPVPAT